MINDWELWACAEHIAKHEGLKAEAFVHERIAALTKLEDAAGVATWRDIHTRLAALRRLSG
jgi:hypothetical protein